MSRQFAPACAGLAGSATAALAPQSGIRRRSRTGSLSDAMNLTTGVFRQLTEQRSALADQNRQGRKLERPAVTKSGAPMIQIMAPVVVLIRRGWLKGHWCLDQQCALEPVLFIAPSACREQGAGSRPCVPENPKRKAACRPENAERIGPRKAGEIGRRVRQENRT